MMGSSKKQTNICITHGNRQLCGEGQRGEGLGAGGGGQREGMGSERNFAWGDGTCYGVQVMFY